MESRELPHEGLAASKRLSQAAKLYEQFESACQAGDPPCLEDFLRPVSAQERNQLLPELLRVELTRRIAAGESPSPEEYFVRFPHDKACVSAAFSFVQDTGPVGLSSEASSQNRSQAETAEQDFPCPAPSEEPPAPRQIGRYLVQRKLGHGAFGTVWLAADEELQRPVAVKVPRPERLTGEASVAEFLSEARMAAALKHPGIVTVYDAGRLEEGGCYVVMEYVEGRSLAEALADGRFDWEQVASLIEQAAAAIHYAHKQGLVHRDLKPANILLDKSGRPHVLDFGVALHERDQTARRGERAGTPAYMAPEQVRGESHRLDGRTDIWSLGVVLYELLVGRRPFSGQPIRELFDEIEHREPKPPRQIDDAVPGELERICLKCLSKRMTDRYPTAADLAADLRDFRTRPQRLFEPISEDRGERSAAQQGSACERSSKIVPKGLRSFDAHDADFFLQLLPGPTDREGLPESLRFWKNRIEPTETNDTFAIGLLYGPSGCGKSSMVKAGLLPRLAPHVLPIYLEATADDTEARLLKALQKAARLTLSPEGEANLADAILALRSGQVLPCGRKALIVLDQFEQWLHAHRDPGLSDLVLALRQCDGVHVQCLAMVRDDFWLAASRFMQALEIPLEQNNSALVDLFDAFHARKVLALFGRAYQRLPAQGAMSSEQSQFIELAVADLSEDGMAVPVRLALFAEMVKGKPWAPATLAEIGGIAGVGETFLEETFSAATAPAPHRLHQKAAQAVLKTLLPQPGTDIKGHVRTRQELLEASGYASREKDFDALLRILDGELRLITPTDPEGAEVEASEQRAASGACYQLTHDYLVPSLREWLTRKQRETRRGRAELRLAERAAAYRAQPDPRHLPGWWEWPNILLRTRSRNWAPAERRVMQAATRRRVLQAVFAAALLGLASFAELEWRRRAGLERRRAVAEGVVERLLVAPITSAQDIVDELEPYRDYGNARLRAVIAPQSQATAAERLRAAVGLLPADSSQAQPIYEALLAAPPDDALALIDVLDARREDWIKPLWQHLSDDDAAPESRLRAAMALAQYDPPHDAGARRRWQTAAPFIACQLLAEARQDPNQFESLTTALAPAGQMLFESLGELSRNGQRDAVERELALKIVAKYAPSDVAALVELVNRAEPDQFRALFPLVEQHAEQALGLLAAELRRKAEPVWNDPPPDPAWKAPAAETAARLESADGLLAERFALCQTLPFAEFPTLAAELRSSGYRPVRLRPYPTRDGLLAAVVWRRDGLDWRLAAGLSADELHAHNERLQDDGYAPIDVAGYVATAPLPAAAEHDDAAPPAATSPGAAPAAETRSLFAALWAKDAAKGGNARLFVELTSPDLPEIQELRQRDFGVDALQWRRAGGDRRYAMILRKAAGRDWLWDAQQSVYVGEVATDRLQLDAVVRQADFASSDRKQQLASAESAVAQRPDDLAARRWRATARLAAGNAQAALQDLSFVIDKLPQADDFYWRARARLRIGQTSEAQADRDEFSRRRGAPGAVAALDCLLAASLGNEAAAWAALEAAAADRAEDAEFLGHAARACAVVADFEGEGIREPREVWQDRALQLLTQAVEHGYEDFASLSADDDFAGLRQRAAFQDIVARGRLERRYAALFETNKEFISQEAHGSSPADHLLRCQKLAEAGYRPAAISAAEINAPGAALPELATVSVWHLPRVKDAEKERIALRQSNALAALLRLGEETRVWPYLAHREDPRLRSWLVHRLAALGVDPGVLANRLFAGAAQPPADAARRAGRPETADRVLYDAETSIQRALILALGEFDETTLSAAERKTLLPQLIELYGSDPDAGVHGAAAWLVRCWFAAKRRVLLELLPPLEREQVRAEIDRDAARLAEIDAELRKAHSPTDGKRWYVNSEGQTMAVVNGPVEFLMGSPADEPGRINIEPLHRRRIDRSFAISAHEVTVDQIRHWQPEFKRDAQHARAGDCPANAVNWKQAAEYCNWLSEKEGLQPCYEASGGGPFAAGMRPVADYLSRNGYRLPTEAEWEFACRAGATTSRYYGASETLLSEYACYLGNSHQRLFPVGSFKPNDLGLYDMLGNALEWCGDSFTGAYAHRRLDRAGDDAAALSEKPIRILRGGAFSSAPSELRSGDRFMHWLPERRLNVFGWRLAERRLNVVGFRVARTVP